MAAWSDKTKKLLIAADDAVTEFVISGWQSATPERLSNAWRAFALSESDDANATGFGKKQFYQDAVRGFRDVPYFLGGNVEFLRKLSAADLAERERIYLEVVTLVNYFSPWDWELNIPKIRGSIGGDGLAKTAAVNKIKFRVLDKQANFEAKVAEEKAALIDKKTNEYAASLGIDVSRGTAAALQSLYSENKIMFFAGGGIVFLVLGYLFIRGKR